MTLILRSLQTLLTSTFKPKLLSASEVIENNFRVLPIDIDVYRHMNNAKYMNYMESVRWGLMNRSGSLKASIQRGWIGPIASMHIDYYRPLTLGKQFKLTTQFVRFEEKWFFVLPRFWSGDKEMARALVKGTVRKGRTNVPPEEYLGALGLKIELSNIDTDVAEWVQKFSGMTA